MTTMTAPDVVTGGVDTHRDLHVAAGPERRRRRAVHRHVAHHRGRLPAAAELAPLVRRGGAGRGGGHPKPTAPRWPATWPMRT
jgi:hypothetical protein